MRARTSSSTASGEGHSAGASHSKPTSGARAPATTKARGSAIGTTNDGTSVPTVPAVGQLHRFEGPQTRPPPSNGTQQSLAQSLSKMQTSAHATNCPSKLVHSDDPLSNPQQSPLS